MSYNLNRQLWLTVFAGLILLASSFNAFAHAQYERSDPGRRAIIARSPQVIKIWFSEQLEPAYSTIVVKDSEGLSMTENLATLDSDDSKLLILKLPTLAPGKYTVFYKVLSVDGHVVDAKFNFKIKPPQ